MDININDNEKKYLLDLVKQALVIAVKEKRRLEQTELAPMPAGVLQEKMGAFVTYHKEINKVNHLRGCIGLMQAEYPLWLSVLAMAYSAACEDHRFPPISEAELVLIHFDITVLAPQRPCTREEFVLGKHGIVLEASGRKAVFLPHVPIEQGWDLKTTFEHLALKAGLPKNIWQEDICNFYCFEGLVLQ